MFHFHRVGFIIINTCCFHIQMKYILHQTCIRKHIFSSVTVFFCSLFYWFLLLIFTFIAWVPTQLFQHNRWYVVRPCSERLYIHLNIYSTNSTISKKLYLTYFFFFNLTLNSILTITEMLSFSKYIPTLKVWSAQR